jgi:N-acetylneuraminate synthase
MYTKGMSNKNEVLFIAEMSANHLGSLPRALDIIDAAAMAGASAIKLQTYTADTMTLNLPNLSVTKDHELWGGRSLYELYEEAHTPWEWHTQLFEHARNKNLIPFSSPFDFTAVDLLESLNCPMYKIASLETGDLELIRCVASTKKPLIISTGATELAEIEKLVTVVHSENNSDLTLLVCTSSYPAKPADAHLNRIATLKNKFGVKVGVSDHTLGIGVSIAAIALGAVAIEKHLTILRSDGGADAAFSLEPSEFKDLVTEGNNAFLSLGSEDWQILDSEKESRRLRRTLYVVEDVKAGDLVTRQNVRAIRPGQGAEISELKNFLGKKFAKDVKIGTPLSMIQVTNNL